MIILVHLNLGGGGLVVLAVAAAVAMVTVVMVVGWMVSDDSLGFGPLFIIFAFSDMKKEPITDGTTN